MTTTPDHADVTAAIERYLDGCMRADAGAVRDAFTPDSLMWGYLGDEYVSQSGADFAANVIANAEPASSNYTYRIHSVTVTGEVANALIDEEHFLGANFRNFFGLVRRDGVWKIASKVFTTV